MSEWIPCPECGAMRENMTACHNPECKDYAHDQPPLKGTWRFSGDLLCCGTLRIAVLDVDTKPSDKFKADLLRWMCSALNTAQKTGISGA